jgi:hypothetical protein
VSRAPGRTILDVPADPVLVAHLVATTGLSDTEAARVVEDVLAFHREGLEAFVRRRHHELQTYGAKNPEIFARIAEELATRVVAAPPLTERQLRRLVYG